MPQAPHYPHLLIMMDVFFAAGSLGGAANGEYPCPTMVVLRAKLFRYFHNLTNVNSFNLTELHPVKCPAFAIHIMNMPRSRVYEVVGVYRWWFTDMHTAINYQRNRVDLSRDSSSRIFLFINTLWFNYTCVGKFDLCKCLHHGTDNIISTHWFDLDLFWRKISIFNQSEVVRLRLILKLIKLTVISLIDWYVGLPGRLNSVLIY